jgi:hypothetical protein
MDYDYEMDEFDEILPFRNQYKYTHLEQYEEHELLELFSIEIVLRYIDFHSILIQEEYYTKKESESDEEFEKRMDYEDFIAVQKFDEEFIDKFGLCIEDLVNFFLLYPYNVHYDEGPTNNEVHVKTHCQFDILNIDLDLNLSEKQLISIIIKHKTEFDDNNTNAIDLLNKIHNIFSCKIKTSFSNFPEGFTEKKKAMIDALFTFDYVVARKEDITRLNAELRNDYILTKNNIITNYRMGGIDKHIKKRNLKEAEDDYKKLILTKPTLNTSSDNCYFKEETFLQSNILPGNAKKNFYIIQKLIINRI